ncbi:MAG: hypothetical protein K6G44_03805 [Lentisphaeria bacterium]|nr:hypothetical protein [Lentisphaeria bacterium]
MNINRIELKKISLKFRTLVSQTINAHYTEIGSRLTQLVNYVNNTSLLNDYVNDCISISSKNHSDEEIGNVINSFGHEQIEMGESVEEVTASAYQIMKFLSGKTDLILQFGIGLCSSNKYQDSAKAFGTNIVHQFASNVNLFINTMMIDMGLDENTQYNITVNGGQVNVSRENSTLNASFNNNGLSIERTTELANSIYSIIAQQTVLDDNVKKIKETLDEIMEEIKHQSPKMKLVKILLDCLNTTASLITLSTALPSAVNSFIEYLSAFVH